MIGDHNRVRFIQSPGKLIWSTLMAALLVLTINYCQQWRFRSKLNLKFTQKVWFKSVRIKNSSAIIFDDEFDWGAFIVRSEHCADGRRRSSYSPATLATMIANEFSRGILRHFEAFWGVLMYHRSLSTSRSRFCLLCLISSGSPGGFDFLNCSIAKLGPPPVKRRPGNGVDFSQLDSVAFQRERFPIYS